MNARVDGIRLVILALMLAYICWGLVYYQASVIANVFNTNDVAIATSDVFCALFSIFMMFLFAYGVLVSTEIVLINGRRKLLIQEKSKIDHDMQKQLYNKR